MIMGERVCHVNHVSRVLAACCDFLTFFCYTLPETNIFAPENGWLEYDRFLLENHGRLPPGGCLLLGACQTPRPPRPKKQASQEGFGSSPVHTSFKRGICPEGQITWLVVEVSTHEWKICKRQNGNLSSPKLRSENKKCLKQSFEPTNQVGILDD